MLRKKLTKVGGSIFVLAFAVLLAAPVFASAWEWIGFFNSSKQMVAPGEEFRVKWSVETSDAFRENTTVYFSFSNDGNEPNQWNEYEHCRHSLVIPNTSTPIFICDVRVPTTTPFATTTPSSTFWVRATKNYDECGGFTPNLDEQNCGDSENISLQLQ